MNIAPNHIEALRTLGYTEDEARFLYIVATHSGYFVARQFLNFTGAHWGKRTTSFWQKLQTRKHARFECFPKSGVIYHLYSRRLYRQIDRENLRNRRAHETEFIKTRLAILDFVLTNQQYEYLETEPEKVRYFCDRLSVERHCLPAKLYQGAPNSRPTVRYFVDKFPMFVSSQPLLNPTVVTLTYVQGRDANFPDFISHLEGYLPLFRQLSAFRFLYVARTDAHFGKAREVFYSLVKIPLESDVADDLLRYFQVRKAWDLKQYGAVTDSDLIFRNGARRRFSGDRFEGLYRGWKSGRVSELGIRQQFEANDRKRTVSFDTHLLERNAVPEGDSAESW